MANSQTFVGWLKATEIETGRSMRVLIQAEEFCEFCRQHTKDVVGNRLAKERLDFVHHFVFPPSHAELLPVRESKKERHAYEQHIHTGEGAQPDIVDFCSADEVQNDLEPTA